MQEQRLNLVQGPDIHVYSLCFQETNALVELAYMHKYNHSIVEWEPAFGCSSCADIMKEKIVAAKNSWLCLIDHVSKGDSTKDMIFLILLLIELSLFHILATEGDIDLLKYVGEKVECKNILGTKKDKWCKKKKYFPLHLKVVTLHTPDCLGSLPPDGQHDFRKTYRLSRLSSG